MLFISSVISTPVVQNNPNEAAMFIPVAVFFVIVLASNAVIPQYSSFLTYIVALPITLIWSGVLLSSSFAITNENYDNITTGLNELGLERIEGKEGLIDNGLMVARYIPNNCKVPVTLKDNVLSTAGQCLDGSGTMVLVDPAEPMLSSGISSAEELVSYVGQETKGQVSTSVNEAQFDEFINGESLYLIVEPENNSSPVQYKVDFSEGEILINKL